MIEQHCGRYMGDDPDWLAEPVQQPQKQLATAASMTRPEKIAPLSLVGAEEAFWSKASPRSASLNTLTSASLNSAVAWVLEVKALRRALAAA